MFGIQNKKSYFQRTLILREREKRSTGILRVRAISNWGTKFCKENKRLLEIEEHYKTFNTNENLRKQFDYILYNNYDKESEEQIIKLVENILNK